MRIASALLISMLCALPAEPVPAAQSFDSSIVVLQSQAADGRIEIGAGVIVGEDGSLLRILTAAHIFQKTASGAVGFYGPGNAVSVVTDILSLRRSTSDDVALVTVQRPPGVFFLVASLTTTLPALGDKLTVVGHPNGLFFVKSAATVVSTSIADYGFAMHCDACGPGDSGGGIFNARGQLLGIVLGRSSFADADGDILVANAVYSVPAPTLSAFLAAT